MSRTFLDQAAGLRAMLGRRTVRVLPVIAASQGGWLVAGLAEAMAATGERVLVIDQSEGECAAYLGANCRFDLGDLIAGRCDFGDAVDTAPCGVPVLLAGHAFEQMHAAGHRAEALFGAFARVTAPADLIIVNVTRPASIARFLDADGEILLATTREREAIEATYCNVKRTCARPHGYQLIVNGVEDEALGYRVYRRIAEAASRFLGFIPNFAGTLPPSLRATADALPESRAFASLAARMQRWRLAEYGGTLRAARAESLQPTY